jgi:excisionase family DNA binding protein
MNDTHAADKARFLTVHEAAELLRLAPKTLYSLVSQRRVPFRKAGRRLLFLEEELVEWTVPKSCRREKYSSK